MLAVSEAEDLAWLQCVFQAGARGYVSKLDDPTQIISGLETLWRGEVYTSTRIGKVLMHAVITGQIKEVAAPYDHLSGRERDILRQIAAGKGPAEMARVFCVSVKTIETYRQRIKDKLNLSTSAQLREAARACWGVTQACLGIESIMSWLAGIGPI